MVEVSNGNFDGFSTGIGLYNSFPNNTSNASLENVNAFNSATGIKAQGWRSITLSDTDISAIKGISLTGMEYANIKGAKIQLINNSNFTSAAGIELSNIDQSLLERVDILGDSTLDSYGISADAEEDSVMNIKNIRGSNLVNGVRYGSNTTSTYNETVFTNISNKCYIGGIKGKLNVCRRTQ